MPFKTIETVVGTNFYRKKGMKFALSLELVFVLKMWANQTLRRFLTVPRRLQGFNYESAFEIFTSFIKVLKFVRELKLATHYLRLETKRILSVKNS